MKRLIREILVSVLVFAVTPMLSLSQSAAAPSAPVVATDLLESGWHVTVAGGYSNLSGASTNNGYLTSFELRVAKHWSGRLDYFTTESPSAKIVVGGPQYNFSLAHVLKNSQFVNVKNLEGFVNARIGAGHLEPCPSAKYPDLATCKSIVEVGAGKPAFKIAYAAGGGVNLRVNDTVVLRPFEINLVRSAGGNQVIGNHLQFASGLGLRF